MASRELTSGPVWRALIAVSAPMTFGILAVLSVGLVDAFFLGQLGNAPLAAVGFIYPLTTALTSLSIGMSAGANAAISQAVGRGGSDDHPQRLAIHAVAVGLLLSVAVALGFLFSAPLLFSWMGASDQPLTEAVSYVPFWSLSFPFLVVMMVVNAIFRAYGDGGTSSLIMIGSALVNIALTPLFIFGWGPVAGMGTEGAALATAIGRGLGCTAAIYWAWRTGVLAICGDMLKGIAFSLQEIFKVGLPAAFSNAINPAGIALVTAAVATLGDEAVAGFGAATRIQSVAVVVLLALSAGIGPVVGQNWGADKQERAQAAMRIAWMACVAYGLCLGVVMALFADQLAGLFAQGDAAAYAAQYLRIVGWSLFGYGIVITTNAAMNARSKAGYSMGLSIGRIFFVYVPAAWVGALFLGFTGVLFAAVAANLLAVGAAYFCARKTKIVTALI
ncbi:MATE family efflux transporter [Roseobacter denitrificans]|uniref:MatE efflux family protein n=1 Tax=Roseobacter denitrificans (strain ATCC 33942 / OCh 114) TaxID=375451 RepID=Q166Q8_ROSDO|nr:MATE family efflux transporter [Roseobacter denitrificans]ABG32035.1 MatE efflux family protein [Roseobacter denitrificans OCh 114]AVL54708.1 MATE family efflux transporter [Roseobacter denitrificans]SFG36626.1 putative efflux protein, MATE family [Roseobacter denitrificans OCh 114]